VWTWLRFRLSGWRYRSDGQRDLRLDLLPGFDRLTPWMNTPEQVLALLAILLLIRRRVLFAVIPR
jgi:hypothetical protein